MTAAGVQQGPDGRNAGTRTPVIGVAGGIGSGKSLVASMLEDLGAVVISADQATADLLRQAEIIERIEAHFGSDVLKDSGQIDREALGRRVFSEPRERRWLEGLLHPLIDQRRQEQMAACRADPSVRAIVLDAPLLFEVGLDAQCDAVIFVDSRWDIRVERVAGSRGWSEEKLFEREKNQKPLDWKRERSDYIINNSTDLADCRQQVEAVFSRIITPGPTSVTSERT